jgi:hypothetical protein
MPEPSMAADAEVAPEPSPPTSDRARPVAKSEPAAPDDPVPARMAASEATPATISFSGDAKSVWLESGGRRIEPGSVPPGTYAIFADFGDPVPARAGTVTLVKGDRRVLHCSSFFSQCK